MISFQNGVKLVQDINELPNLKGAKTLFQDYETSSGRHDVTSLNPWHNCQPCGICITVDDAKGSWYIPVAHHDGDDLLEGNLDWAKVSRWNQEIIDSADIWVNHNVKYDAHVGQNNMIDVPEDIILVDTVVLSKIIDSDRGFGRGTYGLDSLSKDWLGEDISKYEDAMEPYLKRNKDYGAVPIDIMAEYGGQDVISNRRLWKYIQARLPEQCQGVFNTEIELTRVLFEMERNGFCIDPQELMVEEYKLTSEILRLTDQLEQKVGMKVRSWANDDCFDVLCNTYGLPVLSWNDSGNPSFDKAALAQYLQHPDAPHDVVELMLKVRSMNTLNDLFVKNWQTKHIDGVLHPSFNQAVRTGRMSCKDPNAQQFSKDAKKLIHPRKGKSFFEFDYSQIEFRLIVHYIRDAVAIAAYQADPDTDFHTWVAEMCGIPRRPAKNVNFCIGYGGGKRRVLSMLSTSMDLMGEIKSIVKGEEHEEDLFKLLCSKRAEDVFNKYHDTLPNLKRTTRRAAQALKQKGYVFNGAGRHRHLPIDHAHKAFNSLCQSFAADIMKERLVALYKMLKPTPLDLVCTVHDSTLGEGSEEEIADRRDDMRHLLENPPFDIRVPLRVSYGESKESWAGCDD